MHVEVDTRIDRPVEDVFERLARLSEYSRWLPRSIVFTTCRQTSPGPVGPGTTYDDVTKLGTLRGEVHDLAAPHRIAFRETLRWLGRPVMEARMEYALRPDAAGRTEVHHVAEGELRGALGLVEPLVAMIARRERQRTIDALKRSFEPSETGAVPGGVSG